MVLLLALVCQGAAVASDIIPLATGNCPLHTSFEDEHYVIRHAYVEDPFAFLKWLNKVVAEADGALSFLNGQAYSLPAVRQGIETLEKHTFLNDSDEQAFAVAVTIVSVENCSAGQLDRVYRIYSTRISPVLATTIESRAREKEVPGLHEEAQPGR